LDLIVDLYLRREYELAALQLALAMAGMGALLRPRDFAAVFAAPAALVLGLVVQLGGVPIVAAAVMAIAAPGAGIAAGLALVAAVPGGTMSNLLTFLARGNTPLSVTLTGLTTAACLVTTPLLLGLLLPADLAQNVSMPVARIITEIVLVLLLPLAGGMIVAAHLPDWRHGVARWAVRASLALIGVIVIGAAGAGRVDPGAHGASGLLAIALLAVGAQCLALVVAWRAGLARGDATAIGIEVTIRNTNLALLLKASLFPARPGVADPIGDAVLFVALLYGGLALPASVPLLIAARRSAPPATLA
jgi:BASS family bile acid:Na+ symporter